MTLLRLEETHARVREIAQDFASNRHERQRRQDLHREDFDALAEAGFTLLPVPEEHGGLWQSRPASIRAVCDILRTLAQGDPSVALVSAMHPAVIMYWLSHNDAPAEYAVAWDEQRQLMYQSAAEWHWWGTITSEPGSGGDIARTRTVAQLGDDGVYRITGQKHFGSGSGITSFMMTTAVPSDSDAPDLFALDVRRASWDGSDGMTMNAPWDGHGMIATQSHGFMFEGFPAVRAAWPGDLGGHGAAAGGGVICLFASVIIGVLDSAMEAAEREVQKRRDSLNAYEQMEWTRARTEAWLANQALEGMLRAAEQAESGTSPDALLGKASIAELAETVLQRLCRIMGGGSFGRHSPFGFWFEDVRALGFLRPPWGLMYGGLLEAALGDRPTA